jgi:hypothetical protein
VSVRLGHFLSLQKGIYMVHPTQIALKKKKKGIKSNDIKWKEKKHTSALTFSLPSIGRSHTTINPSSVFTTSIGNVYWLRVASTNRKAESILKAKIKSEIKPIYLHNSSYHTTIL